jgi:hypothetical protein
LENGDETDNKCDLEIGKYKELLKLQGGSAPAKTSPSEFRLERDASRAIRDLADEMRQQRLNAENPDWVPIARYGAEPDKHDEADRPNQFTRKQVIYLLQNLIPEFKTADNTKKAEFITKLTGYTSTKNIADEFSNIRRFEDPQLLVEWREKFKATGRGRRKIIPS